MVDYTPIAFIVAVIADSLIGDPYTMPHPIRLFGNSISAMEKSLNKGKRRQLKGGITWLVLVSLCFVFFFLADGALQSYALPHAFFTSLFVYYGLSARCLINEGLKVERILSKGDVEGARKQLSMIVGRDTATLSPTQIRSAVIETLAENLSDGVIAPLFFFCLGGVPLMMTYKMVNTLDSMVGYKNERYKDFGLVSAKMDDVANFIPARLTALLMVLLSMRFRVAAFVFNYGNKHASPNAGYPEAAMAGILDCRLGGPNNYFGKQVQKPYIGTNTRSLTHKDVLRTCLTNALVSMIAYILIGTSLFFFAIS